MPGGLARAEDEEDEGRAEVRVSMVNGEEMAVDMISAVNEEGRFAWIRQPRRMTWDGYCLRLRGWSCSSFKEVSLRRRPRSRQSPQTETDRSLTKPRRLLVFPNSSY